MHIDGGPCRKALGGLDDIRRCRDLDVAYGHGGDTPCLCRALEGLWVFDIRGGAAVFHERRRRVGGRSTYATPGVSTTGGIGILRVRRLAGCAVGGGGGESERGECGRTAGGVPGIYEHGKRGWTSESGCSSPVLSLAPTLISVPGHGSHQHPHLPGYTLYVARMKAIRGMFCWSCFRNMSHGISQVSC